MTSLDDLAVTKPTGIPRAELQARRERLLEHCRAQGLSGYVLFDDKYIQYFTSFGFLATERPVAFVSTADGEPAVFVPEFEVERVLAETEFERVEAYPEYPGIEHPMRILARVLADMGVTGAVGADQDGYPGILGYQGPALSEATGARVDDLAGLIERMMARKSEAEIGLIRESGRWCGHAHRLLQEYSVPGATEAEASLRAGHEATLALLEALGPRFGGQQGSSDGATAGYRGQIGRRSSWAHAVAHNIRFQPGDVLVTETAAPIWGYHAELERGAPPLRPHGRRAADRLRGAAPGRHLRGRRRRRPAVLRRQRDPPALAAAHGPRDRASEPRGAVPRRRRPDRDRAGHGLHHRAGRLRRRGRRFPPLGHRGRHRRRHRDPHRLPERPRESDHPRVGAPGRRVRPSGLSLASAV
jgi:hypothetical protein